MDVKQAKSIKIQDVIISSFNHDDLNSFIQIHVENLFSDSEFSKIYLTERFKYLLQNEDNVTVSAKDGNGKMIGLVYGGTEGYKDKMNKHIMKKIRWSLLKKPHLLFGDEFLYKYKSALKRLTTKFKPRNKEEEINSNFWKPKEIPPTPMLRLTGIAVLEKYSQLGIGEQLLIGYERVAKERNYKSIILETPATNIRAIKFYGKFGWKKYISENENLGKVYFYKLVPENN